jgi:ABC-type branched-subunit amino acid transport system substrate-binding protein
MHEKQDYSQSAGDFLISQVGSQIVSRITYASDAVSYRSELSKLKDLKYDEIIFIPVADGATKIILGEMGELGISNKILGDVNVCDKLSMISKFDIHGQCLKTVLKSDGYNKYISDFKMKYRHEPTYPFYNAVTFDVLNFIDKSLDGVEVVDSDRVKLLKNKALAGIDGAMTSYKFQSNGDVVSRKDYLEVTEF